MQKGKKISSKKVEELKKLADQKKEGEAKIKPLTTLRSVLPLDK